jgi:hypothetical protein
MIDVEASSACRPTSGIFGPPQARIPTDRSHDRAESADLLALREPEQHDVV